MRLNSLQLIRYGRFENAEIVFPRPACDSPDVTVVYGPNEAGKSTAFFGFLEVLFGFKAGVHPYAFRFERSDLLVGAELDLPGRGAADFRRNSKRSQSLLDANNRPVAEAVLASALHGLTRDKYEERFSLDERGLRDGGERIAGAQGDLGQLLHAGVSGLTGISNTLSTLSERADKFHKKHGRGTALKSGNDRLKQLGRDLRADRLTADRERNLRQDRDRTTARFEAEKGALVTAQKRQQAATAAQIWYDRTEEIKRLSEALTDYPDGPDVPPAVAERVAGLVEKIASLETRIAEADAEIADQDGVIEENPVDTLAPALKAELERLDQMTIDGAPLMDRATTARADLDRRTTERDDLVAEIDEVLASLSLSEVSVSAVVLDAAELEDIATAVEDCRKAKDAVDAAEAAADAARAQQGEAPSEPRDLTALRDAFEAWRAISDLTALETERDQSLARLTRSAAGLPSNWADLVDAGLPAPETLEDAARDWAASAADVAAAESGFEERTEELAEAKADLLALQAAPEAVDIAMVEETRRRRDLAWNSHRNAMSSESADDFEAAMYEDDDARAHFLTGAEARQRRFEALKREENVKARVQTAEVRLGKLRERHEGLSEVCATLAIALGLEANAPPAALGSRHLALVTAASAAADHSNAQNALSARRAGKKASRDVLNEAARDLDLDPEQDDLAAQVQRVLALEESDRKTWKKWQESRKNIDELEKKSQNQMDEFTETQGRLDRLTSTLPLPDCSVEGVRAALPHLRSLQRLQADHRRLADRVKALRQAISALTEGAQRLSAISGEPVDEATSNPISVIDQARARLSIATHADEKRSNAASRREGADKARRRRTVELEAAQNDLSACFELQGGEELAPRDRIARLVKRDQLRADSMLADQDRQKAVTGVDEDLFPEELDLMPDATRALVLEQELKDSQECRDSARDAQREAERLYREAFAAADRSDLATERATLLETLRRGGRQAAVARLGALAARGALRRLATERRSEMLRDVEEAFITMTVPKWCGVEVWSQAQGEKLVGIEADGTKVPVERMSAGTMGQLYFALRLAGYRSFARDLGPLPMILDDIMVTFDDTRAKAALQLCAEIGANGQAILFTHHAHLVEMARASIPGVAIVDMPT